MRTPLPLWPKKSGPFPTSHKTGRSGRCETKAKHSGIKQLRSSAGRSRLLGSRIGRRCTARREDSGCSCPRAAGSRLCGQCDVRLRLPAPTGLDAGRKDRSRKDARGENACCRHPIARNSPGAEHSAASVDGPRSMRPRPARGSQDVRRDALACALVFVPNLANEEPRLSVAGTPADEGLGLVAPLDDGDDLATNE